MERKRSALRRVLLGTCVVAVCALVVYLRFSSFEHRREQGAPHAEAKVGAEPAPGEIQGVAGMYGWLLEGASLVDKKDSDIGVKESYRSGFGVEDTARTVLVRLRDSGAYELVESDYLDLYGAVWSCVVKEVGRGRVLFVMIESSRDAQGDSSGECEVRIVGLDAENPGFAFEGPLSDQG